MGNQQPGKAGDGVGISRRIGNGDTIVRRHVLDTRRRLRYSFDGRLDPGSSSALHVGEGNFVLQGEDELDVSDRARGLTDEAGNPFTAFGADSPGPARRGAPAGSACPV